MGRPDFMNTDDDKNANDEGMVGRPDYMNRGDDNKASEAEGGGRPDFMESQGEKPAEEATAETAAVAEEEAVSAEEESGILAVYEVKSGDNLSYISRDHYGSPNHWKEIFEANTDVMKDPNIIRPGMILKIPKL